MHHESAHKVRTLPKGVMFNAYPDSIGKNLSDTVELLKRPEFRDAFSLFYILPTFFNSDLDRLLFTIPNDHYGHCFTDLGLGDKLAKKKAGHPAKVTYNQAE